MKSNKAQSNKLYEAIDVWKRVSESQLIRYRCFRVLPKSKFCVQSADYYYLPVTDEAGKNHQKQFLELLAEQAPSKRSKTFDSLEKAIEMFDKDFSNDEDYLQRTIANS